MPSTSIKIVLIAAFALLLAVVIFILRPGNGEKEFEEGVRLFRAEQYESASREFAKGADRGHAGAQTYLGICYALGQGVEKDEAKAVEWFRKAAEQGDARAQLNLGLCFQEGVGLEKDEAEAVKWFRKAADQGDPGAHISLGICYADGRGVEADEAEAFRWM